MDRISGFILVRCVELSLAVPLYDAYGSADSPSQVWKLFAEQPELYRVGSIACSILVARSAIVSLCVALKAISRMTKS